MNHSITLREYLELLITTLEKRIDTILELQALALEKAELAVEARLETLNGHAAVLKETHAETKLQLEKQSANFVTKSDLVSLTTLIESKLESVNSSIKELQESKARLEGKASQTSVVIMGVVTAISLLISILSFIIKFLPGTLP